MQVKTKDQNRKTVRGQKRDLMKQKLNLKDKIDVLKNNFQHTSHHVF